MPEHDDLIPRPPLIRERLAQARREASRLRRLLRLAEAAARDRLQDGPRETPLEADRQGGGR